MSPIPSCFLGVLMLALDLLDFSHLVAFGAFLGPSHRTKSLGFSIEAAGPSQRDPFFFGQVVEVVVVVALVALRILALVTQLRFRSSVLFLSRLSGLFFPLFL